MQPFKLYVLFEKEYLTQNEIVIYLFKKTYNTKFYN